MVQHKSVIIIGGGLGGLFTGAILSKNGVKVTIVEKNSSIGGGLQTFVRFGEIFDTGMHVISGLHDGCNIRRLCDYLGIYDKSLFADVDNNYADSIYVAQDGMTYKIGAGRENFISSLSRYFPDQKYALTKYVDAMYSMVSKIPLFNLTNNKEQNYFDNEETMFPADDFIDKYITNDMLKGILSYISMIYAGERKITPAYVHALVSVFYLMGPSRFIGGSHRLAELLENIIVETGGQIFLNEEVCYIHNDKKTITSIETKRGRKFCGDYYISDINLKTLINIMDEKSAFTKAFRERIKNLPMTYSAFTINLKFRPNSFRYLPHTGFYLSDYDGIWDIGNNNAEWPRGFLYVTPPEQNQKKFCQKMIITIPMPWSFVRQWEQTQLSQRPKDYHFWKKQCLDCVLEKIQDIFPGIRNCIEAVNTASPLTIRDYYGIPNGAMYGFRKDCRDIIRTQIGTRTKVQNLLLTGQSVNLHGFCGVPLTAIQTSEEILGENCVMNKL